MIPISQKHPNNLAPLRLLRPRVTRCHTMSKGQKMSGPGIPMQQLPKGLGSGTVTIYAWSYQLMYIHRMITCVVTHTHIQARNSSCAVLRRYTSRPQKSCFVPFTGALCQKMSSLKGYDSWRSSFGDQNCRPSDSKRGPSSTVLYSNMDSAIARLYIPFWTKRGVRKLQRGKQTKTSSWKLHQIGLY